jgi:hypothetical protein
MNFQEATVYWIRLSEHDDYQLTVDATVDWSNVRL